MEDIIFNSSNDEFGTSNMLQFDAPKDQSSYIKVIGVGGGGGNAVNNMFRKGIHGVDFIVSNTDAKAIKASPVPNKIVLGELGAGNNPAIARQAALDHEKEIHEVLKHNTQMLFIAAGMGGGTGTGAAPVIARIAKDIELEDQVVNRILVVAVVTLPFTFEGQRRRNQAIEGVNELRKYVDSILIINNDKLRKKGNLRLTEGFAVADDVLTDAVKGIAEIITCSSYVSTDFRDVNSVMEHSGTALMGTGLGSGENRAEEAIKAATTSELLNDNNIHGAQNVLLYFSFHPDHEINYDEMGTVTDYVNDLIGDQNANIIWGTGTDESLGDQLKITIIATGYETANIIFEGKNSKVVTPFDPNEKEAAQIASTPKDENGMHVITKDNITEDAPIAEEKETIITTSTVAAATTVAAETVVNTVEQATVTTQEPAPTPVNENPIAQKPERIVHRLDVEPIETSMAEEPVVSSADDNLNIVLHAPQATTPQQPIQAAATHVANEVPSMHETTRMEIFHTPTATVNPEPIQAQVTPKVAAETQQSQAPKFVMPEFNINNVTESRPAVSEPVKPAVAEMRAEATVDVLEMPIAKPQQSRNTESDINARAQRIARMNQMLHSDPDGGYKIEQMGRSNLRQEASFQPQTSSQSERGISSLDASGNMSTLNSFLYDNPD